jgi:hypothetical protein
MPLQFPTCLKGSIMHAKRRIRSTCRCIGGCVFLYRQYYPLFSPLSHFTYVWDPHDMIIFNLPPHQPLARSAPGCPRTTTRRGECGARAGASATRHLPAQRHRHPICPHPSYHTQRGHPAAAPQYPCPTEESTTMRGSARRSSQHPLSPSPSSCKALS